MCSSSSFAALNDAPPSYRNANSMYSMYAGGENQSNESSFGEMMAKKTKALKNKFKNFWYERKGYKRVNGSEESNASNEQSGGEM